MTRKKKTRNCLTLVGGAEDRKRDKNVLKRMLELSGAKNIIVIPTASFYPKEMASDYYYAFKDLGARSVESFDIRYRDEADRIEYFAKLEKADLVFFSGGDQVKLVRTIGNTRLLSRIKERYFNGTLSVGGSSAGSAAASDPMIYDGDGRGFYKGAINFSNGFGFIDNVIIDTHFMERNRIPRLVQFLVTGHAHKALGIGEDTAVLYTPSTGKCEVVGSGMVAAIDTERVRYSNFHDIEHDELICVDGLRISFLSPGTLFNLKKWKVHISRQEKKEIMDSFIKTLG